MRRSDTAPARPVLDIARHIEETRAVGERIWALAANRLDEKVPACPKWRIRDVIYHLGNVAFFIRACIEQGANEPTFTDAEMPDDDHVIAWATGEWALALENLTSVAPNAPAWNWSTQPPVASFWPRCLTHEAFIHAWDVADAVGDTLRIPADVAADGVDEILAVHLPAGVRAGRHFPISGRGEIHSIDTGDRWLVETTNDTVRTTMVDSGDPVETRIDATAVQLYLDLWGRAPLEINTPQRRWADQLAAHWSAS
ncbi:MAG: maleylpyruvate isomerase family mycothiol-dependent enzyme [Pseudonocardiaceae bacterium]